MNDKTLNKYVRINLNNPSRFGYSDGSSTDEYQFYKPTDSRQLVRMVANTPSSRRLEHHAAERLSEWYGSCIKKCVKEANIKYLFLSVIIALGIFAITVYTYFTNSNSRESCTIHSKLPSSSTLPRRNKNANNSSEEFIPSGRSSLHESERFYSSHSSDKQTEEDEYTALSHSYGGQRYSNSSRRSLTRTERGVRNAGYVPTTTCNNKINQNVGMQKINLQAATT